ncbi:MAG: hypothetical protein NTV43_08125 [Methylococcales bacterium]|nr:hypothetical protein [Methylococcales bacterium]
MSIFKDYWQNWLAGETTDNEVDTYIGSAFAHLVSEYKSVHFEKCILKEPSKPTTKQTPPLTTALEVGSSPSNAIGGTVLDLGTQDQLQPQDTDAAWAVDLPSGSSDSDAKKAELALSAETPEYQQKLAECACQQSPELLALLIRYEKGGFDKDNPPSWDDCALLEIAIIKLLDKNRLKTKLAMLEARYEAVVEPNKFACYKQSIRASSDDSDLKDRIHFLVWDLYWAYGTACKVSQLRQRAIKPLLRLLPLIVLIFLCFIMVYQFISTFFTVQAFSTLMIVLTVIFFGIFGALISFQRRLSKLEVRGETFSNYLQLCSLGNEGPLALFAGGFFALLLLVLFGSGLASAAVKAIFSDDLAKMVVPMFPQLAVKPPTSGGVLNMATAIANLSFVGYASIAKLFIWSFLAGFAEALIPDAMTRLIDKAKLMEK